MSFLTALYTLLIRPLELLFEMIYCLANRIVEHPGLAIIALSLTMNFLVLPLYKRADAMQEEERKTEEKIGPWQERIKKTFKGDERFMMLQAFYRENNYKPTDALKGSLSLMLEIPFFIAAYRMLSSLRLLHGVKFGPIEDLGAPDHMIVIGAVAINLLPILMTLINIVSSAIYTKGLPTKAKVQLYGMALIFLVFLYNSPAGLVFYWTLNNLFSLVKNIFYKLRNPRLVLSVMSAISGVAVMIWAMVKKGDMTGHRTLFIVLFGVALLVPVILYMTLKGRPKKAVKPIESSEKKIFFLGALFLSILSGVLIPSSVLASSPDEFVDRVMYFNPNQYLLYSGLTAAGTFIVWFGFFYLLASDGAKRIMGGVTWTLCGIAITDYMFFGKGLGTISVNLEYETTPVFSVTEQLINIAVLIVVAAVFTFVLKKSKKIPTYVLLIAVLTVGAMSIKNMSVTTKGYTECGYVKGQEDQAQLTLTTEGKNVVVIMLDRAIGAYVPYIFNENPELVSKFDGFTYYPNTVSFGAYTNMGAPALYGGYEYTPSNLNARKDELLADKHDESLLVMPVIFGESGYHVTVCDPSYAGYRWVPDLRIYDDYPYVDAYLTNGKFNPNYELINGEAMTNRQRNLFLYGLSKIVPLTLSGTIYNNGIYNDADLNAGIHNVDAEGNEISATQTMSDFSHATGLDNKFMDAFTVLLNMNDMTNVVDDPVDQFLIFTNDATHEPMLLSEPSYMPENTVDNSAYDAANADRFTVDGRTMNIAEWTDLKHYQVNMASLIQLGEWFDYLRECGVWDNTRIIIVADHGRDLAQFDYLYFEDVNELDVEFFNPLLMVKDFDSEGFTTDMTFMTNADVPTIATDGLIDSPVNPFTGNAITNEDKYGPLLIFRSHIFSVNENNGTQFQPGDWFVLNGDIFEESSWEYQGFS